MSLPKSLQSTFRKSPSVKRKELIKKPSVYSFQKNFEESLKMIEKLKSEKKKLVKSLKLVEKQRDKYYAELQCLSLRSNEPEKQVFSLEKEELLEASSKLILNSSKNRRLLNLVNEYLISLNELIQNSNYQYSLLKLITFSEKLVKKFNKTFERTDYPTFRSDRTNSYIHATIEKTRELLSYPKKFELKVPNNLDMKLDIAERKYIHNSCSRMKFNSDSMLIDNSNHDLNDLQVFSRF